jgi:hypothetical protein
MAEIINLAKKKKKKDEEKETTPKPEKKEGVGVFTDDKGNPTGAKLDDDRVFLGLGADDIQDISENERGRGALPEGTFSLRDELSGQQQTDILDAQAGQRLPDIITPQQQQQQLGEVPLEAQGQEQEMTFLDQLFNPIVGDDVIAQTFPLPVGGVGAGASNTIKAAAINKIPSDIRNAIGAKSISKIHGKTTKAKTKGILDKIKSGAVGGFLLGSSPLAFLGGLGISVFKDEAPFLQQSFNTLGQEATATANDPVLSPSEKIADIQFIMREIELMEEKLNLASYENVRLSNTKEMLDIQTDLFEKKREVIRALQKARVLELQQQFPQLDEEIIKSWVSSATAEELAAVGRDYNRRLVRLLGE